MPQFVIRLPDGRYAAPEPGILASRPAYAAKFPSRWEALAECRRRGPSMAWAQIVPYASEAPEGPSLSAEGNPSTEG